MLGRVGAVVATVAALVLAALAGRDAARVLVAPAALSVVALGAVAAGWPHTRRVVGPLTAAVSALSLAATVRWLAAPYGLGNGPWLLIETAALMVLLACVARWSPPRTAIVAGALGVPAGGALILPIDTRPMVWWDLLATVAFWSLAALVGLAAGGYLRWLDARRVRAVRDARRAQRLQLATDLHDYVAHDVSGMVVQVQAARVVLASDPEQAAAFLDRVEADGARALAAMDRTVRMLREAGQGALPGVADLPGLVERFAASRSGPVRLDLAPDLGDLRWEVGATAYRIVVEALTNVRKHAGPAADVVVSLGRPADRVVVGVTNTGGSGGARAGTGLGLIGLAERVGSLGGTFAAHPVPPDGWQVRAELAP